MKKDAPEGLNVNTVMAGKNQSIIPLRTKQRVVNHLQMTAKDRMHALIIMMKARMR